MNVSSGQIILFCLGLPLISIKRNIFKKVSSLAGRGQRLVPGDEGGDDDDASDEEQAPADIGTGTCMLLVAKEGWLACDK